MRSSILVRSLPPLLAFVALVPLAFIGCSDDPAVDDGAADSGGQDGAHADGAIGNGDSGNRTVSDAALADQFVPDTSVPVVDAGTDADASADADGDADADAGPPPDPTSSDAIQNGTETDVDCGGGVPTNAPKCAITKQCLADNDCAAGTCDATSKRCATAGHVYASYNAANVTVSYALASTRNASSTPTATSMAANGAMAVAIDVTNDILYASSLTDGKIYVVTSGSTSNAGPTHTIAGVTTPAGLAVDGAGDRLFVAGLSDEAVYVFDAASTIDGPTAATRTISAFDPNADPYGLAYDASHDRLFVSLRGAGRIDVYDKASKANGTRSATVSRSFGGSASGMDNPQQIAYDPIHDELYVANTYGIKQDQIVVFANASTLNGSQAPSRKIGLSGLTVTGLALDLSRDELYFGSSNWFKLSVIAPAHTASGLFPEASLRTFDGVQQFVTQLAFDPTRP